MYSRMSVIERLHALILQGPTQKPWRPCWCSRQKSLRPHKKIYLFSVPARPDKSPRPPILFYFLNPSEFSAKTLYKKDRFT